MTVLSTIAEIEKSDAGTARMLLELALYEALCDEVDRVRLDLEHDVRKALVEKAQQGLVHLARQPVSKTSIAIADELIDLVEFGKGQDDPSTKYWDARDPDTGQFVARSGGVRNAIFNALGWATRRDADDKQVKDVTAAWTGPKADNYSRARSLGGALVATNDPNARAAGTVARLIGDIGPEAQKALEPGIRRTAYRYRGTERRPSQQLQEQAAALAGALQGPGDDQKRLRVLSDLGVSLLHRQVPDRDTASISLAAGKMPPSVGLMFDSQGRLVSEAMGYNGDHYLPFDLKNLKRMKGGSYVRTRTTGGLTDEDIYTGLMTGARHMTVVSNSGVFTLEFDPDMRGGRRYSDKARQMVDRYSRLVGAIGSGELYQRKLPRADVQQLRASSLQAAGGNAEQAEIIFRRREKEALAAASFTAADDDDLMALAEQNVAKDPAKPQGTQFQRAVKEEFNRLRAEDADKTARAYRLDGEGYKAALKALKTEFPYFVRSSTFTPLQEYLESRRLTTADEPRRPRGGSDLGYTPRGGLSPDRAGSLGAPKRAKVGDEGTTSTPAAGGAPAPSTPAAGGQPGKRTPEALAQELLAGKKTEIVGALNKTLRARTSIEGEGEGPNKKTIWSEYVPGDDGQAIEPEHALVVYGTDGHSYAQWLFHKHGGWGKAAQFLVDPNTDRKHLEATVRALDEVGRVAQRSPDFDAEDFEAAKEQLAGLMILRQPFSKITDPLAVPDPDNPLPPALPEVLRLEMSESGLASAAADPELEGAMKIATTWARVGQTDEEIASDITRYADRHAKLSEWAANGLADPKPLLQIGPQEQEDAQEIRESGADSMPTKRLAAMNRAWALKRMGELLRLSNPGAADPFAQVAKGHSTASPSRVTLHSPDSPLARAVVAKLAPSRSLRPVRLPASR